MDWLMGLLLLVIGAAAGFFIGKIFGQEKQTLSDKSESEQTIQELMKQQAVAHVQQSKQIAEVLMAQSSTLKRQLEDYEQLLISQQHGDEDSALSFFGEHTTAYLRNKNTAAVREKSSSDVQPLDFSSQSSGLFSGNDEAPIKESK
ncbi:DUF1043 family protein [uncultured Paraglaciecola sp.]|uniref:ZapG family protein n=1 Tax=uncultured Paraglaciecola sp. TaxID=1765024 RepID=UPI002638DC67|nr:DUF1043 family protein [uncultured Paraglaciecola sp.]